ncbi:ATP-binding cassette domain-containing protein [Candidatus Bodocaedibacter vickermanii]|uniref:ATM1-type heavy metal exporter n=1 Tax=Candidatus Bodocaedibacter vickermanii TaxID=2741701 RepID=A0A7L9RV41_9PROT|nr:ATM1-type heavy metal exporter [Candidatus Paracaedibacteraceae bacterium 'Lake Konstanz']
MNKIIRIFTLLLPYLWGSFKVRIATLLTLFLIGIDIVAATFFPYIWKNIIAADIKPTTASWFLGMTLLLFVCWTIKKTAPHFREIVFFTVTNQAIKSIRLRTILKSHTISFLNLEKYNVQEIISATTRVSQSIRQFMRVSFISIFPSISKVISLSIALALTDAICFGIISAAYCSLIVSAFCLRYYSQAKIKAWHLTDNVTVAVAHSLHTTSSARFNLSAETKHLSHLFDLEATAWEKHNVALYTLHLAQDFIFYIGSGIVFSIVMIDYAHGIIKLDKLVLIYGLISSMYSPLLEITRNMTRFFGGIIDLNKTLDILNLPSENKHIQLQNIHPQPIQLDNVSFGYPEKKPLLHNINLTINPGDRIGIFGPSGVGKSTLCHILTGLISPTAGTATYGQTDLYQIQSESLGQVLCYIPQDHTHRELETHEHEHGLELKKKAFSGGEHQRYLINRALEKKPQIIILDETTNALDRKSVDQFIYAILQTVPTVIMITHRQTTLRKMNRFFELKNGHLNEVHQE